MSTIPLQRTLQVLTEDQLALLPTEEDVFQYEKKGWHLTPKILPDELINEGVIGSKAFYNGERDAGFSNMGRLANDDFLETQALQNNEFVCFQKKEIGNIIFHPLIAATAAILARTSEIRLLADSLLCKKPKKENSAGVVGWHTDKAYWPTLTSDHLLTAWIPLQDCTPEMGPVLYIDESHKWRRKDKFKTFYSFKKENLTDFEVYLKKEEPDYKKSIMAIEKGQVCFHNCHTIHCSAPNESNVDRLAIAVHLQDANNKYQKAYNKNGELIKIGYDEICEKDVNGNPNYKDDRVFPILWKLR